MSITLTPVHTGDLDSAGTHKPFSDGLTQSGGTPVEVSYSSFNLSTLTPSQVMGIENGTLQVTLSYTTSGGSGKHTISFSAAGVTDAAESALAGSAADPSGYYLVTNPADTFDTVKVPAATTTTTVNITSQLAAALEQGDKFFVIGAYETKGTMASASFATTVACFAAGTRLATDQGEAAVESLRAGDRVLAGADGTPQEITWIGERSIDLRSHANPQQAAPVRIAADAFADGVPARDLLLSPDHCVHADGRLIPARQLLNGTTITQLLDVPSVRYFHIELAQHTLLRSEGLLTESYLDTGNRAIFSNAGTALILHPEFSVNAGLRSRRDDSCAPLATAAEAFTVWQRLAARAAATGWGEPSLPATTMESDPRLVVAGRGLSPVIDGDRLVFALPRDAAGTVRLTSRATAPATLRPWEDDRRALGLCVRALILHGPDGARRIALDDPALGEGWWAIEPGERGAAHRWTSGNATITLPTAEAVQILEVVLQGRSAHTQPTRKAA